MSQSAIIIENLSKRYLIGHRHTSPGHHKYMALRDVVTQEMRNLARKAADIIRGRQVVQGDEVEEFWALKDVSFEVKEGEVLGIVGRNGAGKSTLLKILSRITEPTEGRVLLRGRVASLLEVGTGFHPELTGRENIFLNGAILGMTQLEIRKKFDEIVAFAEVEKFLDTPVKHYSSGMYVRLAFAVSAHLEPEILIVDEVLAVGDAEFQKKCLGKMDEVSRNQGRTVLFVSHNIEAVVKLCARGVFLEKGAVRAIGPVKTIVQNYLHNQSSAATVVDLLSKVSPSHFSGKVRLAAASPSDPKHGWSFPFGEQLSIDLSVKAQSFVKQLEIGIGIFSIGGYEVASWSNKCDDIKLAAQPGENVFRIQFSEPRLLPGEYCLSVALGSGRGFDDWSPEAVSFKIVPSAETAKIDAENLGGAVIASATAFILG